MSKPTIEVKNGFDYAVIYLNGKEVVWGDGGVFGAAAVYNFLSEYLDGFDVRYNDNWEPEEE